MWRKISGGAIALFSLLLAGPVVAGCAGAWLVATRLPLGPFAGVAGLLAGYIVFFCATVLVYRVFFALRPLPEGAIEADAPEAFVCDIYFLFYLLVFYPVTFCRSIPLPILRVVYLMLGAKLGKNTYCSGVIMDPLLVEAGDNTLIGLDAFVSGHAIEGDRLVLKKTRVGSRVTVGTNVVVLPGVEIGDGALVGSNSVVAKNTRIGPGEVWAGSPARCVRRPGDTA